MTHRDREYDRLFHQVTHSVQTVDVRTRDAHHELRQLLHLQVSVCVIVCVCVFFCMAERVLMSVRARKRVVCSEYVIMHDLT
jgi:hypothetical protein